MPSFFLKLGGAVIQFTIEGHLALVIADHYRYALPLEEGRQLWRQRLSEGWTNVTPVSD
jgi:Ethanolamine utilization protein EutJ (predicted chaperonin)